MTDVALAQSATLAGHGVRRTDAGLAALLALLSTSVSYRFGSGNQLEQIPIILRQLDPTYLSGDFFVSTSVEFGPRFYFARLLALICQIAPLPWVYYTLLLVTDLALVLVTLWAAKRIIGSDRLGGVLASVLVLGVSSFHLGDATQIRYEVFQPANLAIPGALWALGLGLRGRPVSAAVVASIASLAHPLYGVQCGAIALGTAFFVLLFQPRARASAADVAVEHHRWLSAISWTALGSIILAAATVVCWLWPYQQVTTGVALSTTELIDILGRFRAPHHYFPSVFRPQDFVTTGFFVAAAALAFTQWSYARTRRSANLLLLPVCAVIGGCIAGALFTEVWPVREVFTLQPFRLLFILKWVGYLLIGWQFALYWQRPPNAVARPLTGMSLLSSSSTFPLIATAALSLTRLHDQLPFRVSARFVVVAMSVVSVLLWVRFGSLSESIYLVGALSLVLAFSQAPHIARLSGTIIASTVFLVLALNASSEPFVRLNPLMPVFDLSDLHDTEAETARRTAAHTPPDALLVAPPSFSVLRIVGRRAMVVDFKAIPLQDGAMREWRDRMRAVYGDVAGGGFPALERLEHAYRTITDAHLLEIAKRYGATHALLYASTLTALPVVYADDGYRLVELSSR